MELTGMSSSSLLNKCVNVSFIPQTENKVQALSTFSKGRIPEHRREHFLLRKCLHLLSKNGTTSNVPPTYASSMGEKANTPKPYVSYPFTEG